MDGRVESNVATGFYVCGGRRDAKGVNPVFTEAAVDTCDRVTNVLRI